MAERFMDAREGARESTATREASGVVQEWNSRVEFWANI
jgi:hypothetical protein